MAKLLMTRLRAACRLALDTTFSRTTMFESYLRAIIEDTPGGRGRVCQPLLGATRS